MQAETALELSHVSHSYGSLAVLNDISLQVEQGSALAILGPSGSGKSTLLNIAAGLLHPAAGTARVAARGSAVLQKAEAGCLSYMQQDDLLLPWKTLLENIALPQLLKGRGSFATANPSETRRGRSFAAGRRSEVFERIQSSLADFGLLGFENYYPDQLSGGMRQRAALMRASMQAGNFFLLDEPFSRLDALTRLGMHAWFQDFVQRVCAGYVLVTHDPQEALLLADEILVLSGRPARILKSFHIPQKRPRSRSFPHDQHELLESIIAQVEKNK